MKTNPNRRRPIVHRLTHKGEHRRRGIYLLPNLFTTAALFAGFYAIIAAINGRFEAAAICIFIAMILDTLDGRIARLTHTESDFGAEYDSLADMVSFGLAPALVVYEWSLLSLGKVGWLVAFVYVAATALRLARFNAQVGIADKQYFQGLASPSGAGLVAGLVWLSEDMGLEVSLQLNLVALIVTLLAAVLMVSKVRYHSFKGLDLRNRVPFVGVLIVVVVFVSISFDPPLVLFLGFGLYSLSGPVMTLASIRKRRAIRRNNPEPHD